jgi:HK97 family phage portal protein
MRPIFRAVSRPSESRDNGFTRWLDLGTNRVAAGVSVTQETAMRLPVVYRCVALNAETIGALPVDALRAVGTSRVETAKPSWLVAPNDYQDWQTFITQVQLSLELDGNAFVMKAADGRGGVAALYTLDPRMVTVERVRIGGRLAAAYKVRQEGEAERTLGPTEVLHIRGLTRPGEVRALSPVALLRESIGVGLAAMEFAGRWFGDGANLSGVIEIPGGMKPEDAERLQESFKRKHGGLRKSHAIGILTGGARFSPMSVNAEESQFIETQRVTATQIALAFGVPPNYATDAEGTKGYVTGVAAGKMMWLQTGLLTRITRLENAFSSLMGTGYIKLNLRSFLRGSPEEETAYLSAQWDRGILNANEWRALLDLNPRDDGDIYMTPMNYAPAPTEDDLKAPEPEPVLPALAPFAAAPPDEEPSPEEEPA